MEEGTGNSEAVSPLRSPQQTVAEQKHRSSPLVRKSQYAFGSNWAFSSAGSVAGDRTGTDECVVNSGESPKPKNPRKRSLEDNRYFNSETDQEATSSGTPHSCLGATLTSSAKVATMLPKAYVQAADEMASSHRINRTRPKLGGEQSPRQTFDSRSPILPVDNSPLTDETTKRGIGHQLRINTFLTRSLPTSPGNILSPSGSIGGFSNTRGAVLSPRIRLSQGANLEIQLQKDLPNPSSVLVHKVNGLLQMSRYEEIVSTVLNGLGSIQDHHLRELASRDKEIEELKRSRLKLVLGGSRLASQEVKNLEQVKLELTNSILKERRTMYTMAAQSFANGGQSPREADVRQEVNQRLQSARASLSEQQRLPGMLESLGSPRRWAAERALRQGEQLGSPSEHGVGQARPTNIADMHVSPRTRMAMSQLVGEREQGVSFSPKVGARQMTEWGSEGGSVDLPIQCSTEEGKGNDGGIDRKVSDWRCQKYKEALKLQGAALQAMRKELAEMSKTLQDSRGDWQAACQHNERSLHDKLHDMAQREHQYSLILKENREMYNKIQDLKGNIRVYCRIRPQHGDQIGKPVVAEVGDFGEIIVKNPLKNGKDASKAFKFNSTFGMPATQEEIFADTQPLIRSVLDGYKVCIFAYGQTGSGKTFTMMGPNNPDATSWGVNFRALNDLFALSGERTMMAYEFNVQMLEIYNEQVRDLLDSDRSNKRLEIRHCGDGEKSVPEAVSVKVESTEEVIKLMQLGFKNRAVGSTAMNERSSRSHSVLTVHIQGKELGTGMLLPGCLHLVDLAGSERVDRSEATGERLKEAQHINKSLSALGDVIAALEQKSAHVPYRNSKLTQILQDSLGGQAKTLMFVHVSPDEESYQETLSTLKFAERVAAVELGAARSSKEGPELRALKDQIQHLREALQKKDAALDRLRKDSLASSPGHSPPAVKQKGPGSNGLGSTEAKRSPTGGSSRKSLGSGGSTPKAKGSASRGSIGHAQRKTLTAKAASNRASLATSDSKTLKSPSDSASTTSTTSQSSEISSSPDISSVKRRSGPANRPTANLKPSKPASPSGPMSLHQRKTHTAALVQRRVPTERSIEIMDTGDCSPDREVGSHGPARYSREAESCVSSPRSQASLAEWHDENHSEGNQGGDSGASPQRRTSANHQPLQESNALCDNVSRSATEIKGAGAIRDEGIKGEDALQCSESELHILETGAAIEDGKQLAPSQAQLSEMYADLERTLHCVSIPRRFSVGAPRAQLRGVAKFQQLGRGASGISRDPDPRASDAGPDSESTGQPSGRAGKDEGGRRSVGLGTRLPKAVRLPLSKPGSAAPADETSGRVKERTSSSKIPKPPTGPLRRRHSIASPLTAKTSIGRRLSTVAVPKLSLAGETPRLQNKLSMEGKHEESEPGTARLSTKSRRVSMTAGTQSSQASHPPRIQSQGWR